MPHSRSRFWRRRWVPAMTAPPLLSSAPRSCTPKLCSRRTDRLPLTLTGEVQARFRADLSFRVSGRVLARLVDVGAHVNAGDLLARLDPAEQQADFDAATAECGRGGGPAARGASDL